MLTQCHGCNNTFECEDRKFNYNKKRNLNIYCSKKCFQEAKKRNHTVKAICANCGKDIDKLISHTKRTKTGNLYCSRSCSASKNNTLFKTGTKHPNYTNGLGSYRKAKLRDLLVPVCERCGFDNILALDVHHKDGNRKNNDLSNLEVLCCNCHAIEHRTKE